MRRCANVEGANPGGKEEYTEKDWYALEQAEKAQGELYDENTRLRRLVVGAVNNVQTDLHLARNLLGAKEEEVRVVLSIVRLFIDRAYYITAHPLTQITLFPLHSPTAANDKLTTLLPSLRESVTALFRLATEWPTIMTVPTVAGVKSNTLDGEI